MSKLIAYYKQYNSQMSKKKKIVHFQELIGTNLTDIFF